MAPARRGSFDRGDADARGRETDSDDGDERRHHTLTLAQGRALRRELSRHTLHALGGERVCEESSPETTLGSTQAEALGRAFLASTERANDGEATEAERAAARVELENVEREQGRRKDGRADIRSTRRRER